VIEIRLDSRTVEPGRDVQGAVRWEAARCGQDPRTSVRLLWYTEGKGTEDCGLVRQQEVVAAGRSGEQRFTLTAPVFPWTYSGTLLSIIWAVEATMEPGKEVVREVVVCAPGGQELKPWRNP